MWASPHTAFFFDTGINQKAWQKRNPLPGKLLKKVTQKPAHVLLISDKVKLAKISRR
jgi:hypothetical protein